MKTYLLYTLTLFFFLCGIAMSGFYTYEAFLVLGTVEYTEVFRYLPVLFAGLGAFVLAGITWRMAKKSHIKALDDL